MISLVDLRPAIGARGLDRRHAAARVPDLGDICAHDHRAAALGVLGVTEDREAVARAVLNWNAIDLEEAIIAAKGAIDADDEDSSFAIAAILALGAIALVTFPLIGHALHLRDAPDLLRAVADRGIGIEMCPFANLQIKGFAPMAGRTAYPLQEYLRAGVPVTVNTDNIGISAASLSDNLLLLPKLCPGITRLDLLGMLSNSIGVAFIPPNERVRLRERFATHLPLP